ncbi:collagen alpha-1(XII) chain-like isoform X2 [Amphiura filiformis]
MASLRNFTCRNYNMEVVWFLIFTYLFCGIYATRQFMGSVGDDMITMSCSLPDNTYADDYDHIEILRDDKDVANYRPAMADLMVTIDEQTGNLFDTDISWQPGFDGGNDAANKYRLSVDPIQVIVNLEIRNLAPTDHASYWCTFEDRDGNKQAQQRDRVDLCISGWTSNSEDGVTVIANSTGIHVTWDPIDGATYYHVVHGATSNNKEKSVKIVTGNTNSVWLPTTSNTMYTIEVVAIFPNNDLTHLGALNITTENDVFVREVTSNSASIWWGAVDNADEYHILYHPSKDKEKRIVPVRTTQKEIKDLRPDTEYIIEVVAILEDTEKFQTIGEVTIRTKPPGVLNIPIIAGSAAGGLVLLIIVAIILYCCCCR